MVVYRRVPNEEGVPDWFKDESLVQELLDRRHGYCLSRHKEHADQILKRLVGLNVLVDDSQRTWKLGPEPETWAWPPEPGLVQGWPCEMCGKRYPSRNQLFRHLHNAASACGSSVVEQGGIDKPPSHAAKLEKRRVVAQHRAARHATAESCLWFGALPAAWAHTKRFKQLIHRYVPADVPQPWVKKVVRRGKGNGYAVVCFRDAEEAALVLEALNGRHACVAEIFEPEQLRDGGRASCMRDDPGFTLVVRGAQRGDTAAVPAEAFAGEADPPLTEQLKPLPVVELQRRLAILGAPPPAQGQELAAAVTALGEAPVQERQTSGCPLPGDLAERLLRELQGLRWPAKNQRPTVTSERYLVLLSSVAKDCYESLRAVCAELMRWAAPEYRYSGVAVTKNFVASPHIDERDRTYQYAVSLGDFEGGELCVEEACEDDGRHVAVINTKARIARVDGRYVHWVRPFRGDRYSLIFYDTSERHPQPVAAAVDDAWRPVGDQINERLAQPSATIVEDESSRTQIDEHQPEAIGEPPSVASTFRTHIGELLLQHVTCEPSTPALSVISSLDVAPVTWSYQRLWSCGVAAAAALRAAGVTNGDGVALCIDGVEFVVASLAVFFCNAYIVPLDPEFRVARARGMLEDSGCSTVIVKHAAQIDEIYAAMPSSWLEAPRGLLVAEVLWTASSGAEESLPSLAQALGSCPASLSQLSHGIFTSGSTGRPKCVLVEARSLLNFVEAKAVTQHIGPGARVFVASAPTFDVFVGDAFTALCSGATACVAPRDLSAHHLFACLSLSAATHVCLTPAHFALVLAALDGRELRSTCSSLQQVALGGEPLPAAWRTDGRLQGVDLHAMYGVTEACVYQTVGVVNTLASVRAVGRALPYVDLRVCDEQSLVQVEAGSRGEIAVLGAQVARGYLSQPPFPTAENRARVYRTGDMGVMREDGIFEVFGRFDAQIKVRGRRFEPAEVEGCLGNCPLVAQCAVSLSCGPAPHLACFVVLSPAVISELQLEPVAQACALPHSVAVALRVHVQRELPNWMVPVSWARLTTMPLGRTGKICRTTLASMITTPIDLDCDMPGAPLCGSAERLMAALWHTELALQPTQRVGPADKFVMLGGDSLHALRVTTALKELCEVQGLPTAVDWPPAELMSSSGLREYARRLPLDIAANATAPRKARESRPQVPLLTRALATMEKADSVPSSALETVAIEPLDEALLQAGGMGASTVVHCLLDLGANPHPGGRRALAFNALHAAASCGSLSTVRMLLTGRADACSCTGAHLTAAHYAAGTSVDVLELLTGQRGDEAGLTPIGVRDARRQTLLHHAARAGNSAAVRYVCDQLRVSGPEHRAGLQYIDSLDSMGWSALHWCVLNSHDEAALDLLAAGARVVRKPRNTRRASACGHRKVATREEPETVLQAAARIGSSPTVMAALEAAERAQKGLADEVAESR